MMTDKTSRKTYSTEHTDELRRIFTEAANQTPNNRQAMSMRDLIGDLKDDIHNLRQSGYTIDEICELITAAQFEVAPSTLRRYVSAATGKRRPRRPKAVTGADKAKENSKAPPELAKPAPGTELAGVDARAGRRRSTLARYARTRRWSDSEFKAMRALGSEHRPVWKPRGLLDDGWRVDTREGGLRPPTDALPGTEANHAIREDGMVTILLKLGIDDETRVTLQRSDGTEPENWEPNAMIADGWVHDDDDRWYLG